MEDDIQTVSVGAGRDSLLGEFAKMSDGYMTLRSALESTAGQLRDTQAAISIFNDFMIQYFIESGGRPDIFIPETGGVPRGELAGEYHLEDMPRLMANLVQNVKRIFPDFDRFIEALFNTSLELRETKRQLAEETASRSRLEEMVSRTPKEVIAFRRLRDILKSPEVQRFLEDNSSVNVQVEMALTLAHADAEKEGTAHEDD